MIESLTRIQRCTNILFRSNAPLRLNIIRNFKMDMILNSAVFDFNLTIVNFKILVNYYLEVTCKSLIVL